MGKWDLMKEPNMALREIRDIRPHLVLEGHIVPKTYLREEGEEKLGLCKKKLFWCDFFPFLASK